ncbi:hypothetical protein FACS1894122_01200 [Alphaproteobacteria bacterium]|nr:hypothetical protein FACS1894122_01200 [Alphaproteobacteria bacterium]
MKFCGFVISGVLSLVIAMCGSSLAMDIQDTQDDSDKRAHEIVNKRNRVWRPYMPVKAIFDHLVPGYSMSNWTHLYEIAKNPTGRKALLAYAENSGDHLASLDCLDAVLRGFGDAIRWDVSYALAKIAQDSRGIEALYAYAMIDAKFEIESVQRKLMAIASMQNATNREDIEKAKAAATNTLLSKYGYSFEDGVLTAPKSNPVQSASTKSTRDIEDATENDETSEKSKEMPSFWFELEDDDDSDVWW